MHMYEIIKGNEKSLNIGNKDTTLFLYPLIP